MRAPRYRIVPQSNRQFLNFWLFTTDVGDIGRLSQVSLHVWAIREAQIIQALMKANVAGAAGRISTRSQLFGLVTIYLTQSPAVRDDILRRWDRGASRNALNDAHACRHVIKLDPMTLRRQEGVKVRSNLQHGYVRRNAMIRHGASLRKSGSRWRVPRKASDSCGADLTRWTSGWKRWSCRCLPFRERHQKYGTGHHPEPNRKQPIACHHVCWIATRTASTTSRRSETTPSCGGIRAIPSRVHAFMPAMYKYGLCREPIVRPTRREFWPSSPSKAVGNSPRNR